MIDIGVVKQAGLVSTNSIRGGANRSVLDRILHNQAIYEAWSDEEWNVEGAAVNVSLVCFGKIALSAKLRLDGKTVSEIHADLTSGSGNLTSAMVLAENEGIAFNGISKKGSFDVSGALARDWLQLPHNVNARPNSDVVRPWINGLDVTRRVQDMWIIDFGERSEKEASLYEKPYSWVRQNVLPERSGSNSAMEKRDWWLLARRAPAMRTAIKSLRRYIVTPEVSKYRIFIWVSQGLIPDKNVVVVARDDDTSFGLVQSRYHCLWALRLGTSLEDRPRYTSTTTFRTYPFPAGLTPNIPAKDYATDPRAIRIAAAAIELNELRENWLNPTDLLKRVPEVVAGYPDRILPVSEKAAKELKKRTLTNLYNERPQWLVNAHKALDEAVAAAYGWPADLSDDEILARLLELNLARAAKQQAAAEPAKSKKATPEKAT